MIRPTCPRCARPLPDTAYVDRECERGLGRDLLRLAELLDGDVLATVARLDRHGSGGGRSSEGSPLPVNLDASARAVAAAAVVLEVAGRVSLERGVPLPASWPAVGPLCRHGIGCRHRSCYEIRHRYMPAPAVAAARWLVGQLGWVRYREWGPAAFDRLARAAASLVRVVDSPPERIYRGPCEQLIEDGWCDGELYSRAGADRVRCPKCGTEHLVDARARWLASLVRERSYTAADIAAAYPIRADTIRVWAHRGRIVAHGYDGRGRPLYPLGEVLDLAAAEAGRRATAQARRQRRAETSAEEEAMVS